MNPEVPIPEFSPEKPPVQYGPAIEISPNINNPESNFQKGAEQFEQRSETKAITSDVGLTSVLPTPLIDDNKVVKDTTITDTPTTANDDDLIEKEWVDKAKKIVAETRDDPYKREEAVSKLQIDYIKKRYGRELGAAE